MPGYKVDKYESGLGFEQAIRVTHRACGRVTTVLINPFDFDFTWEVDEHVKKICKEFADHHECEAK